MANKTSQSLLAPISSAFKKNRKPNTWKTTIRFWLRTDRPNKDGSSPIHLVYQIQGERKYYAVPGVKLFPVNWDQDKQLAVYLDKKAAKKKDPACDVSSLISSADVGEINSKLNGVRHDIVDIEKRFKLDKISFSPEMVIDKLKEVKNPETKKDEPGIKVIDFIRKFSRDTTAHKAGTIKAYNGLANHLMRFEKEKKQSLTFESIDVSVLKSFQNFLLKKYSITTKKGNQKQVQINNITIAKILSTLKTLLRKAEDEYDHNVNPKYKKFKNPHPRKDGDLEVIALTDDELTSIMELDLSENKALDEARDIFLFSVTTSLRYGDLKQFGRQHITKDNTIKIPSSHKNGKPIEVPLTPISFSILKKYADRHKPLPVTPEGQIITSQKLNVNIKKIGKMAGIDSLVEVVREHGTEKITKVVKKYELLSIHKGRKSFITLCHEKGMSLQDIMALSTHSNYKSVKRYVNIDRSRKKTVMENAWGKIDDNNLKAV